MMMMMIAPALPADTAGTGSQLSRQLLQRERAVDTLSTICGALEPVRLLVGGRLPNLYDDSTRWRTGRGFVPGCAAVRS